jgi:hypothetical protein
MGITPDVSTRALWHSYQQKYSGASRRNGLKNENFAYQFLKYLKGSLTFDKILRQVTSFTSHLKEGVLRIFIAFKNLSPRLGLAPVANTLTTTPLR